MSDRSEDLAESDGRSPRSTDDLLAETDRLLSESSDRERMEEPTDPLAGAGDRHEQAGPRRSADRTADRGNESASRSSLLPSMPSGPSIRRYFSARAFLALVVLLGIGFAVGGLAIPFAGRIVGLFAVAFAIGTLSSRRRYLEMTAAGGSVGAAAALANYAVLAVAGSGRAVVAVGASAGLVACVGGYYFGRDLRDGLQRDIE